jgi:AraC family transcriptional regulator of adaptative response/methylated-DNA-[protein]-cysteine methyltransferase
MDRRASIHILGKMTQEDDMKFTPTRDRAIHYAVFSTPLGKVIAAEHKNRLFRLEFLGRKNPGSLVKPIARRLKAEISGGRSPVLEKTRKQLKMYFDGRLKKFNLPLELMGTDFQRSVWRRLTRIPHGKTVNYGRIAERIGRPKAARAAGMAIGSNPISIIVPCHRVIGKSGDLVGFGGGLWRKRWLLKHEGALS